jgi:flagellar basal-body rod protein FlgC
MDTIAGNIANINTLRDAQGRPNPYRRRFVVFAPGLPGDPSKPGVHVSSVQQDQSAFPRRYDPGNPDADKLGYVSYPNVDMAIEMVNSLEASRAYEANVTMMDTAKSMFNASLRLLA